MGYGGGSEFCASTAGGSPFGPPAVVRQDSRSPTNEHAGPDATMTDPGLGSITSLAVELADVLTRLSRSRTPPARSGPRCWIDSTSVEPAHPLPRLRSLCAILAHAIRRGELHHFHPPHHPSFGRGLAVPRMSASRRHAWGAPSTSCPHRQQSVTSISRSRWHPQWVAPVVGQVGEKAIRDPAAACPTRASRAQRPSSRPGSRRPPRPEGADT